MILENEKMIQELYEHTIKLNKTETIQEVISLSRELISRSFGFKFGSIGLIQGNELVFPSNEQRKGLVLPLDGTGITVRAMRTGEIQVIADTTKDPEYVFDEVIGFEEIQYSELDIPIKIDNQVVGILNIESPEKNRFSDHEVRIMSIFVETIASTIQRIEAREKTKQYETQLEALHETATDLIKTSSLDKLYDTILKIIVEVLKFQWVGLAVPKIDCIYFTKLSKEGLEGYTIPLSAKSIVVRAYKTKQTQLVEDITQDPDYSPVKNAEHEYISELVVPILVQNEVRLLINIESDDHVFTEYDRNLIEIIGKHASSALERLSNESKIKKINKDLKRSNQDLENYSYVVSHDLKAPLRSIKSFGGFLLEDYSDVLDDDGKNYLNRIIKAATHMDDLIGDLLLLSRVGRKFIEEEEVDLNNLLDEIKMDIQSSLQENKAEIHSDPLPIIITQKTWIRQLFMNLITNGLKFNKSERPGIWIKVKEKENEYQFSVTDNGIGISPEYHEKIFQLFQRLHTNTEYEGTGAGLTICKKIVEDFGGTLCVESEPGKGSTYIFTAPK